MTGIRKQMEYVLGWQRAVHKVDHGWLNLLDFLPQDWVSTFDTPSSEYDYVY